LAKDRGVVLHSKNGLLTSLKFTGNKNRCTEGDGTFESLNATTAVSVNWLTTGNSGIDPSVNFIGTTGHQGVKV
jgi:hypothetical protein